MPSSLGRAAVVVVLVSSALGGLGDVHAEPPAQPTEVFVPCVFRGRAELPINTLVTDAEGHAIARFSGAPVELTVAGLSTGSPARARVETGSGQGGFRVRGFIEARKLPISTAQSVPVAAGHVWISAHRSVSVVQVTPTKLMLEKKLSVPLQQTFTAWTSCSSLSLGTGVAPGWTPAGDARGYVLRKSGLELYDAPSGSVVSVLYKAPEVDSLLFFSTEQAGAWVHVEYHGEVVVDGWAKASELQALPRGETLDQLASAPAMRSPARLAVQGNPRVVRTTREVPLRAAAKAGDPSIGVIESGTETYVLDVMAGWVSVMPKALDVVPVEGRQFWVKKEELGI